MRYFAIGILFFWASLLSFGQSTGLEEGGNLVPNPGFEEHRLTPEKWYFNGEDFSQAVRFWSSPTQASPDLYGPYNNIPKSWKDRGFATIQPKSGTSMVGITAFGCIEGKPHCREYLQIKLKEPLVVGQKYSFEFWINRLPLSLEINNIGVAFPSLRIKDITTEHLSLVPLVKSKNILSITRSKWKKINFTFKAVEPNQYMIIGNFSEDVLTKHRKPQHPSMKYAYYYLDDIKLKKIKPIIATSKPINILEKTTLAKGQKIKLDNIYFDSDKSEFLPTSYPELKTLLELMKQYPKLVIEIHGHTDNQGDNTYNMNLSASRAMAVSQYLNQNGISKHRTKYQGFGSTRPISTNDTKEGRSKNRRVEFVIIRL